MPRAMGRMRRFDFDTSSSDDDFQEEDFRRVRVHRRPRERQQREVVIAGGRRPRSASTGARRGRDAQVYIDINNEQAQRGQQGLSPNPRQGRHRSMSRRRPAVVDDFDELEEEMIRAERAAERAAERVAQRHQQLRPRSPSPRADLEAQLQLEKIRRREREMEERYEERMRMEEEKQRRRREKESERGRHKEDLNLVRREIENELQLEQLKIMQQDESRKRHVEDALLVEKMKALEQEQAERDHEQKIRDKIEAEKAKEEAEELERLQRDAKLKREAVEEHKKREAEKELKKREAEEKADKDFEERVKKVFGTAGYSEEHITTILKRKEKAEAQEKEEPVFVKVHRRFISPETLDAYHLPWEWHDHDADYILINSWINEDLQEELFEHTRRLREPRLLTAGPANPAPLVGVKVNDAKRDKMYLVRKKSPARKARFW